MQPRPSTLDGEVGLDSQIRVASVGILATSTLQIEVKGLMIGPLYLHTFIERHSQSPPGPVCISFTSANDLNVHNNTMHDAAWCLSGSGQFDTFTNNEIYNFDHGVGMGGTITTLAVGTNRFHDMANWDPTGAALHHDGVHVFDVGSTTTNGVTVNNNLFDGDQGANVTAEIYLEHASSSGTIENASVFNNVIVIAPTRVSCCGWISFWNTAGSGTGTTGAAYNNSIYGAYVGGTGNCPRFQWLDFDYEREQRYLHLPAASHDHGHGDGHSRRLQLLR